MTVDEAKMIFAAWRPDGSDHADPVFQEAVELARREPSLMEWLHSQQDFDLTMVASLEAVRGPADGRLEILAHGRMVVRQRAAQRRGWLSLAATVLILAAAGWWRYLSLLDPVLPDSPFTLAQAAEHLSVNHKAMEFYSTEPARLQDWLRRRGSPSPDRLPGRMEMLTAYGAQDWRTSRGRISLMCFYADGVRTAGSYGEEAEWLLLFAFQKGLAQLQEDASPRIVEGRQWIFIVWREGDTAYAAGLPANPGARERLRHLVGV